MFSFIQNGAWFHTQVCLHVPFVGEVLKLALSRSTPQAHFYFSEKLSTSFQHKSTCGVLSGSTPTNSTSTVTDQLSKHYTETSVTSQ